MSSPLISIAALAAIGGLCQWFAWKLRLPSIVFLLTAGIVAGPVTGFLDPDALFGDLLFPFVSLAVAIILFEGGLTLRIADIRGHGRVVTRLISVGVLLTWLLLAAAAHLIFDLGWPLALVFGSIVVVSGPTVVKPLLRTVRPSDRVGSILHWEGILIDPIGVFLALLVFEYVLSMGHGEQAAPHLVWILAKLLVTGSVIGVASGFATAYVLRQHLVPDFLRNVLTLSGVVAIFTLAETIQHESGLLAVTIMGVWLANARGLHVDEILHFKENLTILLISTLFVILAARVDLAVLPAYGAGLVALLLVAQLLVRPFNAWLCTIGADLDRNERLFLGWIAPRGIVAAAVSSLFALRLQETGIEKAELLVPLTFSMIIGTVLLQSFTAKLLANRLGISNPEPNGVLLFGAGEIGLQLAEALRKESVKVVLSDTTWRDVQRARQAGFEAYHGNPTSGHAEENLDLQGIGKLIAVSSQREANALAGIHYRQEFGSDAVFTLEGTSEDEAYERFDTANRHRGNALFDASLTYSRLQRHLRDGTIVHVSIEDQPDPQTVETATEEHDIAEAAAEVLEAATGGESNGTGATRETDASHAETGAVDADSANGPEDDAGEPAPTAPAIPDDADDSHSSPAEIAAATADGRLLPDDLPMFAIDPDGKLRIYSDSGSITPKPGWRIVALRPQATGKADTKKPGV